ncbi:hypothetical protein B9479_007782 [Cryptococcus floricola]|uniref:Uncharacterized protein n=1 Tax=Cryptococcus floricola TaxID=2591691 RepID=A0A5D3ANM9_9TREE|nr:hypothetical protein B9479_007782 [Cryptococcus floricola]
MSEDEQAFSNPPSPLYVDSSPIDDPQPSETSTDSGSRSPSTHSDSGSDVAGQDDPSKIEYKLSPDIPVHDQLSAMAAHLNSALHEHFDMSPEERRELILSKVQSSLSGTVFEGHKVDLHWGDSDDDGSGEDEDERRGRSPRRRGSFSLVEEEEEE